MSRSIRWGRGTRTINCVNRSLVCALHHIYYTAYLYVFFSIYTYYHAYIECNSPYSIYRAQQHIICLFFVLYIYNSGFSSYFEWPAAAIKRKGHFKWRGIYTQQGLHTQQHSSSSNRLGKTQCDPHYYYTTLSLSLQVYINIYSTQCCAVYKRAECPFQAALLAAPPAAAAGPSPMHIVEKRQKGRRPSPKELRPLVYSIEIPYIIYVISRLFLFFFYFFLFLASSFSHSLFNSRLSITVNV
jgi:hypothetical protein